MTDGERFDQDEIARFGDPWHGLYRGGVLELPTAATRALPGAAPANGENYKVMIPGQPAVTTDAGDTAAGMTWLNYGVLSGKDKRLYGVNLGEMKWIYVDADNLPWLATLSLSGTTLTVSLVTFGVMEGTPATYSASTSLTLPASTELKIDDIDSAGRQLALTARKSFTEEIEDLNWSVCQKVWLLTISGAAAAVSLALSLEDSGGPLNASSSNTAINIYWIKDPDNVVTGPFTTLPWPVVPPDYFIVTGKQSGVFQAHTERAIGATLHNDVFELVLSVTHQYQIITVTPDLGSLFDPYYAPQLHLLEEVDETSYYGIKICGNLTTFNVTQKSSRDGPYGAPTSVAPLIIAGYNVSADPLDTFQGWGWPYIGDRRIIDLRLGNRAYGACAYSYDTGVQHLSLGAAGPVSSSISPFLTSSEYPIKATAHHTTGALEVSNIGVVCWL